MGFPFDPLVPTRDAFSVDPDRLATFGKAVGQLAEDLRTAAVKAQGPSADTPRAAPDGTDALLVSMSTLGTVDPPHTTGPVDETGLLHEAGLLQAAYGTKADQAMRNIAELADAMDVLAGVAHDIRTNYTNAQDLEKAGADEIKALVDRNRPAA